jgi:hypothetical protein
MYSVRETCVLVFIAVEYCFNIHLALSLEYVTGISSIIQFFLYLIHFLIHCQEYGYFRPYLFYRLVDRGIGLNF